MIVVDKTEICRVCKSEKAVVLCDGCEMPICRDCQKIDLWGYGCGHVDPKVFCGTCYDDININPYGGKRS